ncbi:MAG TPA: histidine--tRNA ligase [Candidatus Nanoarchaeia archaeon]|nr:histidine--tRNA ligase [Candidatus Nanoarchaeia archaeon]
MQAKGTRDYPPEEKLLRNSIVHTIKSQFEKYGFLPLETATLDSLDSLTSKFAGGEEILKEIYKLKDQGKRDLALRFDLTVPLARYIGENPHMKMPFKRYEIGKVFRDGPIKAGRLREFWQCDGDVIGSASMLADAEVLTLARDVFKELNIDIVIKVNNRKLLNGIMAAAGITKDKEHAILSLDKLEKFGKEAVKKELKEKKFNDKQIKQLLDITLFKGTNDHVLAQLFPLLKDTEGVQGLKEIEELLSYLKAFGTKVQLDISLARGLNYYTGTIYEVYTTSEKMTSSIAAGGRWDTMISKFLKTDRIYPAVGISFGLEPITTVLTQPNPQKTSVKAYVIPIGTVTESIKILQKLRDANISADIDLLARNPGKALAYADASNIPFAVLIGDEELKQKSVKIKDLKTGKEVTLIVDQAINMLQKQ